MGGRFVYKRVVSVILGPDHEMFHEPGYGFGSIGTVFLVNPKKEIGILNPNTLKSLDEAKPLFNVYKQFPIVGEIVLTIKTLGKGVAFARDNSLASPRSRASYYIPQSINLFNVVDHNAFLQSINVPKEIGTLQGEEPRVELYTQAESGMAINSQENFNKEINTLNPLGNYFKEQPEDKKILPLYVYEGDTIIESRFGSSIRFGSTIPYDSKKDLEYEDLEIHKQPYKNPWSVNSYNRYDTYKQITGSIGDPIIIIRNGQGNKNDRDTFLLKELQNEALIENPSINESSIYLTSNQSISELIVAGAESSSPSIIGQNTYKINIAEERKKLNSISDSNDPFMVPNEALNEEQFLDKNPLGGTGKLNKDIIASKQGKEKENPMLESLGRSDIEYNYTPKTSLNDQKEKTQEYTLEDDLSFFDEFKKSGKTDSDFENHINIFGVTIRNGITFSTSQDELLNDGQTENSLEENSINYMDNDFYTQYSILEPLTIQNLNPIIPNYNPYDFSNISNLYEKYELLYNVKGVNEIKSKIFNYFGDLRYYTIASWEKEVKDNYLEGTLEKYLNQLGNQIDLTTVESYSTISQQIENSLVFNRYLSAYKEILFQDINKRLPEEKQYPNTETFLASIEDKGYLPSPSEFRVVTKHHDGEFRLTHNEIAPGYSQIKEMLTLNHPAYGKKAAAGRNIRYLVIHCSGTSIEDDPIDIYLHSIFNPKSYTNGNFPYHYIIGKNGKYSRVKNLEDMGNTDKIKCYSTAGKDSEGRYWNDHSIQICWVGGKNYENDSPTKAQAVTLHNMIMYYMKRYPGIKLVGHNQILLPENEVNDANLLSPQAIDCPGFYVPTYAHNIGLPPDSFLDLPIKTNGVHYDMDQAELFSRYQERGRLLALKYRANVTDKNPTYF